MELGNDFFLCGELIFARKRENFFFGIFLVFFGVFVLSGVCVLCFIVFLLFCFSRAARFFFELIFSQWS